MNTREEYWQRTSKNKYGVAVTRKNTRTTMPNGMSFQSFQKWRINVAELRCEQCRDVVNSKTRLELDHKIPVFCGGDLLPDDDDLLNNFQVLCKFKCHRKKSVRDRIIVGIMKKLGCIDGGGFTWYLHCSLQETIEVYRFCEKLLIKKEERIEREEEF